MSGYFSPLPEKARCAPRGGRWGDVGDGHPLLERLTPPILEIAADYWIIVHRDLRRSACVRAVVDWIKALFAGQHDVLAGVV
jgi:DNA-binding transcriptional LysR family regulator